MKKLYCQNCKCSTTHKREPTSHLIHFILTVLFGGVWAVIWLWRYIIKGWKCEKCDTISK